MRPSKFITETIAQKMMAKFGFGHRYHDLKCFWIVFIFLDFVVNLRAT
jgi:hypothetical protein